MPAIVKTLLVVVAIIVGLILAFWIHWLLGLTALLGFIGFVLYVSRSTIYAQLGNIAYMKGDPEKALAHLEKASRMKGVEPKHLTGYAYVLLKTGRIAEAEAMLNDVLPRAFAPLDKMQVRLNLATAHWLQGRRDEALTLLEEVHAEYKNTSVYGNLGYFRLLRGDLEESLAFNLEAYEYNDSDLTILDNVAQNYFLLGRYEEAADMYVKVMAKAPKHAESYYYYALTLLQLGRQEEAREQARQAAGKPLSLVTALTAADLEELQKQTGA